LRCAIRRKSPRREISATNIPARSPVQGKAGPNLIPGKGTETQTSLIRAKGSGAVRQIDFGDWRGPQGPVNTISDEEIDHKRSGSD
jgi:hypothetical protein